MTRKTSTRRSILKKGAALSSVAALGSLAGCSDSSGGNTTTSGGNGGGNGNGGMTTTMMGGTTTTTTTTTEETTTTTEETTTTESSGGGTVGTGGTADIGDVPAAAQTVITMDMDGMIQDSSLQSVANTYLQTLAEQGNYEGPTDVQTIIDEAGQGSDISASGVGDFTLYMQVENVETDPYFGMILYTGFTENQLITAFESDDGGELTRETYGGRTIYVGTDTTTGTGVPAEETVIGPLNDGNFVVGTRAAAEDAIDVATGSGSALGNPLRSHYQSIGSGYLRFASMVPEEQLPESGSGGGSGGSGGMQIDGLEDLQAVSGRFYTSGSNIGMDVNMHTGGSSSASDLSESVDSLIRVAGMQYDNPDVQEVIDSITVTASGSTATVTYEQTVSKIQSYIEKYASALVGPGMGGGVGGVGGGSGTGSST